MVKDLLTALTWFLPTRPSIVVMHWGPDIHELPLHLRNKFDATEAPPVWLAAVIAIENISNRTLGSVRIKLNSQLVAAPEVTVNHSNYPDWTFDEPKGELTLHNIDPKTHLYVQVFCSLDDRRGEISPEFLVDGVLHDKVQNSIASWIQLFGSKFGLLLGGMAICALSVLGYAYTHVIAPCSIKDSDTCRLAQASSRIKGYCSLRVERVTTSTRLEIVSSIFPLDMTLFVNKVRNMDELLAQDRIVICAPITEDRS